MFKTNYCKAPLVTNFVQTGSLIYIYAQWHVYSNYVQTCTYLGMAIDPAPPGGILATMISCATVYMPQNETC